MICQLLPALAGSRNTRLKILLDSRVENQMLIIGFYLISKSVFLWLASIENLMLYITVVTVIVDKNSFIEGLFLAWISLISITN